VRSNLQNGMITHMGKLTAPRDTQLVQGVVSRLKLFWGASPEQIAGVVTHCRTLLARPGHVLVKRGERLPGVFAIAYGSAKLALREPEHEERVVGVVTAGQIFGAATALLDRPARYDVLALTESKLIVIPSASIFALIDREPRFARNVVKVLAERNIELLEELEAATMRRGAQRLASYLHSLAQTRADASASRTVHLPVSKSVVAARLGLKKETLSRLFRQFTADGLIVVSRRDIKILDAERLTEVAG
jgi:CRP/FNR family transcriptional regulator, dissimilatory nitrate respiration regulator